MASLWPIAILAGGAATRMLPLTEKIPKSMLMVAGEPFISHQLQLLQKSNFSDVVICGGYLSGKIQEFVGDGAAYGLNVQYSLDGTTPLGTGGALKKALPLLGKSFFAIYGDSYLTCPFSEIQRAFEASSMLGLMTVFRNEGAIEPSNVHCNGEVILNYNKAHPSIEMQHVDYGLSVFHRDAFSTVPEDTSLDLSQIHKLLISRSSLACFEVKERYHEIGSRLGLLETEAFLLSCKK
jgi:MurNAc alpha-1-phosphate uridylyltransferase